MTLSAADRKDIAARAQAAFDVAAQASGAAPGSERHRLHVHELYLASLRAYAELKALPPAAAPLPAPAREGFIARTHPIDD
jgi:hypothetical protein